MDLMIENTRQTFLHKMKNYTIKFNFDFRSVRNYCNILFQWLCVSYILRLKNMQQKGGGRRNEETTKVKICFRKTD